MNIERIKELQEFANNFNEGLKYSDESYVKGEKKLNINSGNKFMKRIHSAMTWDTRTNDINNEMPLLNQRLGKPKMKRNVKSCKRKQPKLNRNLYKNLLPWFPPHFAGRYFEDFKILKDQHTLSNWEKVTYN